MSQPFTHYRAPVYETSNDRQKEAEVADRVARYLGAENRPTKKFSFVDFVLYDYDRTVIGFLEVKCRTYHLNANSEYKVSAAKLFHCHILGNWYKLPCYLAVDCPSGLYIIDAARQELGRSLKLGFWGRKDRPLDSGAQEATTSIPMHLFTQIV